MDSEYIYALQSYYLPKYHDLFKVIAYLGGCIMRQQMTRLLFKNKTDCSQADALVKKLVDSKLVKTQRLGANTVLILTYPVFRYLNINRTANINGTRLKVSALIMEKYLRQGVWKLDNPVLALRKRMEKTAALAFVSSGEAHMRQMYALMEGFEARGLSTDGLRYQYVRAEKRMEHDYRSQYDRSHKLALPKEPDLYTLECKNTYLVAVRQREDAYGRPQLQGVVDIYHMADLIPSKMAERIVEAKRVIESTLQNDSLAIVNIYSHEPEDADYMEKVYAALEQYPEYTLPDTAREQVSFHYFDTRRTLFGSIAPSAIK